LKLDENIKGGTQTQFSARGCVSTLCRFVNRKLNGLHDWTGQRKTQKRSEISNFRREWCCQRKPVFSYWIRS